MTETQARTAANVMMGVAAAAAAAYVLSTPSLRRKAWQILRLAVAAAGPVLMAEARRAWQESDPGRPVPAATLTPARRAAGAMISG
jgi:hypothetical protein